MSPEQIERAWELYRAEKRQRPAFAGARGWFCDRTWAWCVRAALRGW